MQITKFKDLKESHCVGMLTIENIDQIKEMVTNSEKDMMNADLGIMIRDNKVWVCVNGIALLRFKSNNSKRDTL